MEELSKLAPEVQNLVHTKSTPGCLLPLAQTFAQLAIGLSTYQSHIHVRLFPFFLSLSLSQPDIQTHHSRKQTIDWFFNSISCTDPKSKWLLFDRSIPLLFANHLLRREPRLATDVRRWLFQAHLPSRSTHFFLYRLLDFTA